MWFIVMNNVKNRKKTKKKKGRKVPKNVRNPLVDTSLHIYRLKSFKKVQKNEVIMDRPTDQQTDRQS